MAATDEARLLVRLEATSTKMERELVKAGKLIRDFERKVSRDTVAANNQVTESLNRKARALNTSSSGFRSFGSTVQNTAFQVGDFAVQVAGGTSATRALAQQLPQLLGGFGVLGAVAGAAAAAFLPLAANLFSTEEASVEAEDAFGTLIKSISEYRGFIALAAQSTTELRSEFGEFASDVQRFSQYIAEVQLAQTVTQLKDAATAIKGNLSGFDQALAAADRARSALQERQARLAQGDGYEAAVRSAARQLEKYQEQASFAAQALGLTADQAARLSAAIDQVSTATTMEDIARAASGALAALSEIERTGLNLPPALQETARQLKALLDEAAAANVEFSKMPSLIDSARSAAEGAASAVGRIGTAAQGALGSLSALAQKAWEAAQGRLAAEGNLAAMQMEFSPAGQALARFGSRAPGGTSAQRAMSPPAPASRGSAVGGGSSSAPNDFLAERRMAAEREFELARIEARAVGLVAEAATKAKIKIDLLNEANRQKLDLNKQNTATGLTLREEIDRQSDAIGRLTVETERYRERSEFAEQSIQDLKSGFLDAIVEGENLSGTLEKLAKSLARAALEAAFFGSGPFAGGGGGGGLLGGLLGGIFGGFRAEGGPVQAGRAYVVGERGPELMVPHTSGSIIPNGGGKGGGVSLSVSIDARGAQIGVADQIRAEMVRTLPQIVRQSVQGVKAANKRGF